MPNLEPISIFSFLHSFLYSEVAYFLLKKKRMKSFQGITLPSGSLEFDGLSSPEYHLDNSIVNDIITYHSLALNIFMIQFISVCSSFLIKPTKSGG